MIKQFVRDYFIIYAGCMMGTLVFCTFFYPAVEFGLEYFRWMMLFALLGDLPVFIFYSRRELTEKQIFLRYALHMIVLEVVLLTTAYFLGCYENFGQGCFFAMIILGVYVIVRLINYHSDSKIAKSVNQRLKEIQEEENRGY